MSRPRPPAAPARDIHLSHAAFVMYGVAAGLLSEECAGRFHDPQRPRAKGLPDRLDRDYLGLSVEGQVRLVGSLSPAAVRWLVRFDPVLAARLCPKPTP